MGTGAILASPSPSTREKEVKMMIRRTSLELHRSTPLILLKLQIWKSRVLPLQPKQLSTSSPPLKELSPPRPRGWMRCGRKSLPERRPPHSRTLWRGARKGGSSGASRLSSRASATLYTRTWCSSEGRAPRLRQCRPWRGPNSSRNSASACRTRNSRNRPWRSYWTCASLSHRSGAARSAPLQSRPRVWTTHLTTTMATARATPLATTRLPALLARATQRDVWCSSCSLMAL
mmetsp:Transcript_27243/g.49525  ORF Transcript_27243/g.49525 Transcript_27243/m.49525 type:complete len:232 (-) Transcript_27243:258-953(-)